jgi:hypothetical protein
MSGLRTAPFKKPPLHSRIRPKSASNPDQLSPSIAQQIKQAVRDFDEGRNAAMFEVGQEVTVITEKGVAYNGCVLARATGDKGAKAYKIAVDGAGLQQLGQWHKACDVFVLDAEVLPKMEDEVVYTGPFGWH